MRPRLYSASLLFGSDSRTSLNFAVAASFLPWITSCRPSDSAVAAEPLLLLLLSSSLVRRYAPPAAAATRATISTTIHTLLLPLRRDDRRRPPCASGIRSSTWIPAMLALSTPPGAGLTPSLGARTAAGRDVSDRRPGAPGCRSSVASGVSTLGDDV